MPDSPVSDRRSRRRAACLLVLCLFVAPSLGAAPHDGAKVLVVANAANADSIRIAEHYGRSRLIPSDNLLRLTALPPDPPDGIDRVVFDRAIQGPIAAWLARNRAQDRILFIVLTKGIPLRINARDKEATAASVDSELTLLYRQMTGVPTPPAGRIPNPYFLGAREINAAKPFTRAEFDIYLVTRLDGYTVDDVLGVIDRGASPSSSGRFVLDGKSSWTDKGNEWLRAAAERLRAAGLGADRVIADESTTVLTDQVDVLGYYSWGSNDPAIRRRSFNLKFRPGAIGGMFVSTDGRTFREPPRDWEVGNWANQRTWFAGSPQSLAGDLIREGITGMAGHVSEPYLGNTIRPDILFPAYVAGYSLAEAYYLAMPSLSWQTVVVGDPLCRPFGKAQTGPAIAPEIDPKTELPAVFSRRRLQVLADTGTGVPPAALELLLRAEGRIQRGDSAGAAADLERATTLAPGLGLAHHTLAGLYEAAGKHDDAIRHYRLILKRSPQDVLALNNLAYALATMKGSPKEALPFAEEARELAPSSGSIADTLGWIHHLLGDNQRALSVLGEAAKLSPGIPEIRLHLAKVHRASGNNADADRELAAAQELDPSVRGHLPEKGPSDR